MQRTAIRIIQDEHLAIGAVLYSLRYLARRIRDEVDPPDFRLLHAMLDYVVEYPDRWHHPKENQFLFKALRERAREAAHLVAQLEAEHEQGSRLITALKDALARFERGVPGARAPFIDAVEEYAQFQWDHIRKEEEQLLPLAERVLSDDDWESIATAFEENDNPLFGIKPKDEAERLYRTIMQLAPPPLGVGQRAHDQDRDGPPNEQQSRLATLRR